MNQLFVKLCNEKFQFLVEEFGFKRMPAKCGAHGCALLYRGQTTSVAIYYERRDQAAWVSLKRLTDGKEPDVLDKMNQHGLWSVVRLKAGPDVKLVGSVPTEADMERVLTENAHALRTYAADILRGDFSLFPELYRVENE